MQLETIETPKMSAAKRVLQYAARGPLFKTLSSVPPADEWCTHGTALAHQLNPQSATEEEEEEATFTNNFDKDIIMASRIFHLYLPIFFWCRQLVKKARATNPKQAVGIGLSAPQGCGKTTLVNFLTELFHRDGLVCSAVSFDDFYLTGAEQDIISVEHASNPLLQVRGNAGTHDVELGERTLRALLQRDPNVAIPRYNKSARNGKGDRYDSSMWFKQTNKSDVVLLEGWMAGFVPTAVSRSGGGGGGGSGGGGGGSGDDARGSLREIDGMLSAYDAWHQQMDAWVVVEIDELEHVYQWRMEAEHAMKASGRDGMSDDEVREM